MIHLQINESELLAFLVEPTLRLIKSFFHLLVASVQLIFFHR